MEQRFTLYHYARLPQDQQAAMWKLLDAEIEADEAAKKPTLVKKFYRSAMYRIMTNRSD